MNTSRRCATLNNWVNNEQASQQASKSKIKRWNRQSNVSRVLIYITTVCNCSLRISNFVDCWRWNRVNQCDQYSGIHSMHIQWPHVVSIFVNWETNNMLRHVQTNRNMPSKQFLSTLWARASLTICLACPSIFDKQARIAHIHSSCISIRKWSCCNLMHIRRVRRRRHCIHFSARICAYKV